MTPAVVVVLITAPEGEVADGLARTLVEERLAACVNVLPGVRSVYRWQGAIAEDREALLLVKLGREGLGRLRERVLELHPYDVPEVVALSAAGGLETYMEWVVRETMPEGEA